ncbi:7TM domain-containing protein [Botrimarina sp.]|uniref:7TM domain-containing protein n=1 Tax=Botrimarina sp. TaxID=2795802 RepID=UPI0032EE7366
MSSRTLSQLAVVALLVIGVTGAYLRYSARQAERLAREDSRWQLTYDVTFKAPTDATAVHMALPVSNDHIKIRPDDEEFITGDLIQEVLVRKPSGTRELIVRTDRFRQQPLHATAEFVIRLRPSGGWGEPQPISLSGDARARYLQGEPTIFPKSSQRIRALLSRANSEVSADNQAELLQWIFNFCSRTLRPAPENHSDDVLGVEQDRMATPLGRVRMMVTLCRAAGMPARVVTGFVVRQGSEVQPIHWVEVFRDFGWQPYDPENGYARRLPDTYLAARLGGEHVVYTERSDLAPESAEELSAQFSLVRLDPDDRLLDQEHRRPTQVLDLTRLPVDMHQTLALLLLLPLGALITAFFRNIVGVPTFGTFAPALFAVSFIYADWGSGLVILAVVFVTGLIGRTLVNRLQLLMVPRLSIILTLIILCVVFGVSALQYFDFAPSAKAALLPLVIVTILIERFYVTIEEDGAGYAAQLAAGTLAVGAACYFVLSWNEVGRLVFAYPELHLVTIALFVAIGRYAGYRVIELWRFRDLVQNR